MLNNGIEIKDRESEKELRIYPWSKDYQHQFINLEFTIHTRSGSSNIFLESDQEQQLLDYLLLRKEQRKAARENV